MKNALLKIVLPLVILAAVFIGIAIFAQAYRDEIEAIIRGGGIFGMVAYIILGVFTVVAVPISILPIVPIASAAWGPLTTGFLNVIGWFLGSLVAFGIARVYGLRIVKKIVSDEQLEFTKKLLPGDESFWTVVFMRVVMPADILSYALGIFSRISWEKYALATLIGITPFAFVFAYLGSIPVKYQVVIFSLGILIITAVVYFRYRRIK